MREGLDYAWHGALRPQAFIDAGYSFVCRYLSRDPTKDIDAAEARLDIRTVPGDEEHVLAEVRRLLGSDIEIEVIHQDVGLELPFSGDLVTAMIDTLHQFDPEASVFPYLMPAGTDNKALSKIGIEGYGFVPMQLPKDYDFVSMFHGVDERIPLEALDFGHRVLTELLRNY